MSTSGDSLIASVTTFVLAADAENAADDAQIAALQLQAVALQDQINALQGDDAADAAQIAALQAQLAQLNDQIAVLQANDSSDAAQIAALQSQVSTLQAQMNADEVARLDLGELSIAITSNDDHPLEAVFGLPNGTSVTRPFPPSGELHMRLGLGLALTQSRPTSGGGGGGGEVPVPLIVIDFKTANYKNGASTVAVGTLVGSNSDGYEYSAENIVPDVGYTNGAFALIGAAKSAALDAAGCVIVVNASIPENDVVAVEHYDSPDFDTDVRVKLVLDGTTAIGFADGSGWEISPIGANGAGAHKVAYRLTPIRFDVSADGAAVEGEDFSTLTPSPTEVAFLCGAAAIESVEIYSVSDVLAAQLPTL